MRLPLLDNDTTKDFEEYSLLDYAVFLTDAGIDVFNSDTWQTVAYLPLVGITNLTCCSLGILYGTNSGVYLLTWATVATTGNMAGLQVLKFHTGSTPSLLDNSVTDLAAYEDILVVTTSTGITFIPDVSGTTKYAFTVANTGPCAINSYSFAVSINNVPVSWQHATANFSLMHGQVYSGNLLVDGIERTVDNTVIDNYVTQEASRGFNFDNYHYWRNQGEFMSSFYYDYANKEIKDLTWNPVRTYIKELIATWGVFAVVGHTGVDATYGLELHERVGSQMVKRFETPVLTESLVNIALDATGTYLVVVSATALKLYKLDQVSKTLTLLTAPTRTYGSDSMQNIHWCGAFPEYCVVSQNSSVASMTLYKMVGDTMVRQVQITGANQINYTDYHFYAWIGDKLIVSDAPNVHAFKLANDTLTLMNSQDVQWHDAYGHTLRNFHAWGDYIVFLGYISSNNGDYVHGLISLHEDPNDPNKLVFSKQCNLTYWSDTIAHYQSRVVRNYDGEVYCMTIMEDEGSPDPMHIRFKEPELAVTDFSVGNTVNKLAMSADHLFVATDQGVKVVPLWTWRISPKGAIMGKLFKSTRVVSMTSEVGTVQNVKYISMVGESDLGVGYLAYGTNDGAGNGRMSVIQLNAV